MNPSALRPLFDLLRPPPRRRPWLTLLGVGAAAAVAWVAFRPRPRYTPLLPRGDRESSGNVAVGFSRDEVEREHAAARVRRDVERELLHFAEE